jgi:hypothetical protein
MEALRSIKTALIIARSEKGANQQVSEENEIKILQKLLKQRKESAEVYDKQGRTELAEQERKEASYIQKYLPEQISDEELTNIIKGIIEEVGAESMKDMGKVMGVATRQLAGKAEGKAISDKVKSLLSGE